MEADYNNMNVEWPCPARAVARSGTLDVAGAVLVGGESRRMGSPKALLRVPEGGPTMLERVLRVIRHGTDEVMLIGTEDSLRRFETTDAHMLVDGGEGPVSGVIAALRAARQPRVLVAACDMPFLSVEVMRRLVIRSTQTGLGVCPVTIDADGSETLQPLLAIYMRSDADQIERMFHAGERSLSGIVRALNMTQLPVDDLTPEDRGHWSFFNVNTPMDLAVARRHATKTEDASGAILDQG